MDGERDEGGAAAMALDDVMEEDKNGDAEKEDCCVTPFGCGRVPILGDDRMNSKMDVASPSEGPLGGDAGAGGGKRLAEGEMK